MLCKLPSIISYHMFAMGMRIYWSCEMPFLANRTLPKSLLCLQFARTHTHTMWKILSRFCVHSLAGIPPIRFSTIISMCPCRFSDEEPHSDFVGKIEFIRNFGHQLIMKCAKLSWPRNNWNYLGILVLFGIGRPPLSTEHKLEINILCLCHWTLNGPYQNGLSEWFIFRLSGKCSRSWLWASDGIGQIGWNIYLLLAAVKYYVCIWW